MALIFHFSPFPKQQILDSSKLKAFAEDNFEINENGRQFSKRRKGETVCNKLFLLFSQCFLPYMVLIFHFKCTLTLSQITDSTKLKEFADDNFKFDVNGRKLSKLVENTVGKGEIAHYKHFLFFSQCFQKGCFSRASKVVIVWEWVKGAFGKLNNIFQDKFNKILS